MDVVLTFVVAGYGRKASRSAFARTAVGWDLVPKEFWNRVDDLTAQVLIIFKPLIQLLMPYNSDLSWYKMFVFWQELHVLVSWAAFFQVCTALSPSVFHFLSATPGARMDYPLEQQADVALYRQSKTRHESQHDRWRKAVDAKLRGEAPLAIPPPLPTNAAEVRVAEHHRLRGAKIKFAVFPKLTMYRRRNLGRPLPDQGSRAYSQQELEDDFEGQRIVNLSNCRVVYYQGLIYPRDGQDDSVPLEVHLNTLAQQGAIVPRRLSWVFSFFPRLTIGSGSGSGYWCVNGKWKRKFLCWNAYNPKVATLVYGLFYSVFGMLPYLLQFVNWGMSPATCGWYGYFLDMSSALLAFALIWWGSSYLYYKKRDEGISFAFSVGLAALTVATWYYSGASLSDKMQDFVKTIGPVFEHNLPTLAPIVSGIPEFSKNFLLSAWIGCDANGPTPGNGPVLPSCNFTAPVGGK
ncbi:Uu.00g035790.m01.CDS01 [Anthostomella pinea]|uniref:Uu.00g035790.m01.CDS01 n=1 Tax=Anthostomella pinea TaxID=933095 RepID=A0AAI8VAC0_9PEZI|nr:Uu.00g035790.m01.CDS01 [Anthostomella pinea]